MVCLGSRCHLAGILGEQHMDLQDVTKVVDESDPTNPQPKLRYGDSKVARSGNNLAQNG